MAGRQRYTVQQICDALDATRGLMGHAAKRLGCTYETIVNYRNRYPCVRQLIEEYRGELVDTAEYQLAKAVERNEAWAVVFVLKYLGSDRGYRIRQEPAGQNGQPVRVRLRWKDTP